MRLFVASVLGASVGVLLFTALSIWPIMLLLGAVGSFIAWVPILSFWQTALFVVLLSYIGAVLNPPLFKSR